MNIPYYLVNLSIGPEPDKKTGRIQARGTLTEEDLLERMTKRGTGISYEDMQATLNLLTEEVTRALADGNNVITRLANYKPGIKGVFDSATDPFDASQHYFRASLTEGTDLKKAMRDASGERISVPQPAPVLIQYVDHASQQTDSTLTPESIGELIGEELKFDGSNEAEGIFFVPDSGGDAIKVEIISILTEGRLMFMVPKGLEDGDYTLEVRRAYTNESLIRTGSLHSILTVN